MAQNGSFNVGGTLVQFGSAVKNVHGKMQIPFNSPFSGVPLVSVTSYWQGSSDGVGFAETVTFVDSSSFEVVSGNHASNYFVNWIAMGPGKS